MIDAIRARQAGPGDLRRWYENPAVAQLRIARCEVGDDGKPAHASRCAWGWR